MNNGRTPNIIKQWEETSPKNPKDCLELPLSEELIHAACRGLIWGREDKFKITSRHEIGHPVNQILIYHARHPYPVIILPTYDGETLKSWTIYSKFENHKKLNAFLISNAAESLELVSGMLTTIEDDVKALQETQTSHHIQENPLSEQFPFTKTPLRVEQVNKLIEGLADQLGDNFETRAVEDSEIWAYNLSWQAVCVDNLEAETDSRIYVTPEYGNNDLLHSFTILDATNGQPHYGAFLQSNIWESLDALKQFMLETMTTAEQGEDNDS